MVTHNNCYTIVKAIGIILMVIGHSGCPILLKWFIYFFHMPLFFFCSGYFLKSKNSFSDILFFIVKRIKGLYCPYIKWCVLFLFLHNIFYLCLFYDKNHECFYGYSDYENRLIHIFFTMTGQDKLLEPFWFIKQLFISSIVVCVITYMFRKINNVFADILLWLSFVFLTVLFKYYNIGAPIVWDLSILCLSACFYYSGYLYSKYCFEVHHSLLFFCICCLIILLIAFLYGDNLDMLWYTYKNVLIFIPIALLGIFMIIALSRLVERYLTRILGVLYYIGNHTIIILSLHSLAFKIVSMMKILIYGMSINHLSDFMVIPLYNEFFWVVYSFVGIVIPLCIYYIWTECEKILQKVFVSKLKNDMK